MPMQTPCHKREEDREPNFPGFHLVCLSSLLMLLVKGWRRYWKVDYACRCGVVKKFAKIGGRAALTPLDIRILAQWFAQPVPMEVRPSFEAKMKKLEEEAQKIAL
jgi:hypothetical protein